MNRQAMNRQTKKAISTFLLAGGIAIAMVSGSSALDAGSFIMQQASLDPMARADKMQPLQQDEPEESAIPREIVEFDGRHAPGTIIVDTTERRLYLVLKPGSAMRYGVGVGRPGFEWKGVHTISSMNEWPDWRPPAVMLKRRPDLPRFMAGGPENPLGARALYLGSSIYRIHGSNEPDSIGQAVSSGCIRMTNDDVTDLYERVRVGTKVVVL